MDRRYVLSELSRLRKKRERLERVISRSGAMINASLVEVYLGTKAKKRSKPNYYLSWKESGKTRLRYVKKQEKEFVTKEALRWREYKEGLVELIKINRRVENLLREWGKERTDGSYKDMGKRSK